MDPTGVLRAVDVSHHQDGIDVGRLPVELVIARTAQAAGGKYGTTVDRAYAKHKANARRAGKLFCSYLYLGNAISAAANAALHASVEPDRGVPVMADWEDGSGNAAFLRAVVAELKKLGYRVALTYAPRWYWQAQGSPSLAGLPPLVSSRYPDRVPGDFDTQYRKIPTSFWDGYGGNTVAMVQISANGRLQPYPGTDLDLDAYRGTRTQLAALLNQEDDMPLNDADITKIVNAVRDRVIATKHDPGDPNAKTDDVWTIDGRNFWDTVADARARAEAMQVALTDIALKVATGQNVPMADLVAGVVAGLLPDIKAQLTDVQNIDEDAVAVKLDQLIAARFAQ